LPGVRGAQFPSYIEPLLATQVHKPVGGDQWVHEIKFDGYRLQIHKQEAAVRCFTRRGYDWSDRFPTLVQALWPLKTHAAILDGEVVALTLDGIADFGALESYVSTKKPDRNARNVLYYAFDLLYLDGLDLRNVTLIDRKRVLKEFLSDLEADSVVKFSDHFDLDGSAVYRNACGLELEGIVSKRKDSRYRSGRNGDWLKITCRHRETFLVAGIAYKGRKFDGIYLGREQEGKLVFAGKVENGFDDRRVKHLQRLAEPIKTGKQPIASSRTFPKAQWLKPVLLAEVEYRGKTKHGNLLRHPAYKGLREDLSGGAGENGARKRPSS
jgi:bifunctional non-homologous end joining protein LigD